MPRILDNIEHQLLPALRTGLGVSDQADFCVGYFNLRGWRQLDDCIEQWSGGEGNQCRLLVGIQRPPREDLQAAMSLTRGDRELDNQAAARLKKQMAQEFREQLAFGAPATMTTPSSWGTPEGHTTRPAKQRCRRGQWTR